MLKKNVLRKSDIYAIIDLQVADKRNLASLLKNLIKNNIRIIQLRDKKSSFNQIFKKALFIKNIVKDNALLIINDYPQICLLAGYDGVHLGQKDLSIRLARKIVGEDKIIGISCHNLKQATSAQNSGADYLGLGSIFTTQTKKNTNRIDKKTLYLIKKRIKIPYFLIGGINSARLEKNKLYKIKRIAVCRTLCESKDIKKTVSRLRGCLN